MKKETNRLNSAQIYDKRPVSYDNEEMLPELVGIRCQAEDSTMLDESLDALHFGTEDLVSSP